MHYRFARLTVSLFCASIAVLLQGPALAEKPSLLPDSPPTVEIRDSADTISIFHGASLILSYNKRAPEVPPGIDPVFKRSGFLHPVATPSGRVVTGLYPADHAHQCGIFSGWVSTLYDGRPIDFWNLADGTGRVVHEGVRGVFSNGFEVDLLHRALGDSEVDVLRERWRISLIEADSEYYCFDLETTQTALTDNPLLVNQYHYGGMAYRGPAAWLIENTENSPLAVPKMHNHAGANRRVGNHQPAKWVTVSGTLGGEQVSITVLGHQDNFRAPQPARLHPTKPYFVFSPCVAGEFVIDLDRPLNGAYRYFVSDRELSETWLEERWQTWCSAEP